MNTLIYILAYLFAGYITVVIIVSMKDDIVIGDEVLDVARVGLVTWEDFKEAIEHRSDPSVLLLTGRRAPDWLMEQATTISSTTQLKHHGRAIQGMDC